MDFQVVSNWVPTGSHTFCPECQSPEVWVAYVVYPDNTQGWRYVCRACTATGKGEMKEVSSNGTQEHGVDHSTHPPRRFPA